ncbi:MAG: SsrA-binding protein [Streptococcus salivarius]
MPKGEGNVVAQNKKARHDYSIVDTIEAGIVLTGTEIKSVRAARIQLKDGYAQIKMVRPGYSMSILPFRTRKYLEPGSRPYRKLLLKKSKSPNLQTTLREQV